MTAPIVSAKTMNTQKTRPVRVNWALAALWLAWTVSLAALGITQLVFKGSGLGPGWALGILSLTVQAVVITFVGRGDRTARAVTVAFSALAVLPLPMLGRLIAEKSFWAAVGLTVGFGLKTVAVVLLFTREANEWFAS